jgi:hypothetical protein
MHILAKCHPGWSLKSTKNTVHTTAEGNRQKSATQANAQTRFETCDVYPYNKKKQRKLSWYLLVLSGSAKENNGTDKYQNAECISSTGN